jgi:exodeoxyribonuclease VII small subunit
MTEASSRAAPAPTNPMAPAASGAAGFAAPDSYETGLRELERLLADMESGQLPLDRLLENYQRGAELLKFCRARLEAVETQVKLLEDGVLKPWNPPS